MPSRPVPPEIPELHLPEVSEGDFRFGSSLAGPGAAMATGGGAPRACCLDNAVIDRPRKHGRARRECPGPFSALSIPQGSHPGPHPSLSLERTPPSPPHSAGRSSAPEHAHSSTSPPGPDYVSQNALCTSPSASLPFPHPLLCFHPPPSVPWGSVVPNDQVTLPAASFCALRLRSRRPGPRRLAQASHGATDSSTAFQASHTSHHLSFNSYGPSRDLVGFCTNHGLR